MIAVKGEVSRSTVRIGMNVIGVDPGMESLLVRSKV